MATLVKSAIPARKMEYLLTDHLQCSYLMGIVTKLRLDFFLLKGR